jgi:predicted transglutaminase-like cysteine proteinase
MGSSTARLCKRSGTLLGVAAGALFSMTILANAAHLMHTGGVTSQPIGHFEFCKTHASECDIRSEDKGPEPMSGDLWRKIVGVNTSVNASVEPMTDIDIYGKDEAWNYPKGFGDCEDYVLEKRRLLIADGIPVSDLLITVVRKPDGEGHAVLTVRTDAGDFILDNLSGKVRSWEETGYRFLKRQASTNTGRWVSIRGGESTRVGAVD